MSLCLYARPPTQKSYWLTGESITHTHAHTHKHTHIHTALCRTYSEEYLEAVKKTPHMSLDELRTFTQQYGDVYFHPVR